MNQTFEQPYCEACKIRLESALSGMETQNIDEVSQAKVCNLFKKGQIIFEEGGKPNGIYCLHGGKVKVYKTGDEGRQQIVRFAKPGDIIGYRSMVSGEPYAASAAAIEDSVVCCIPLDTFTNMMEKDTSFSWQVMQLLSGDLRRAESQIMNLAQKPVRERLAETLLVLREVYGTENGNESAINVKLSREELASVVGTATETLVRTLADLKREKLIATEKKKIRILDVAGLIEAGNLQD